MQPEELRFTLHVGDKQIGEQRLKIEQERSYWLIKAWTQFSHRITGSVRKEQVSRMRMKSKISAYYFEVNEAGGRKTNSFETVFDRKSGLVTVRQGRDEASQPLTRDYQDPLTLIQMLRELPEDTQNLTVPMIGANVHIQRLPDQDIATVEGTKSARVYYLRPGLNMVFIEKEAPYRPLKLTQPVEGGVVDVLLKAPEKASEPSAPRQQPKPKPQENKAKPKEHAAPAGEMVISNRPKSRSRRHNKS